MSPSFKPSSQVLRFARLIETLAGHEFDALSNVDIAAALDIAPPEAFRLLRNAAAAGWAEQTPDKRWRLCRGKFTNIATAVQHGIQKAQSRMNDEANNYTRSMY